MSGGLLCARERWLGRNLAKGGRGSQDWGCEGAGYVGEFE